MPPSLLILQILVYLSIYPYTHIALNLVVISRLIYWIPPASYFFYFLFFISSFLYAAKGYDNYEQIIMGLAGHIAM